MPKTLTIVKYPHPALRKKAKPVKKITPAINQFCQDFLHTLAPDPKKPLGVGLAANQVNKLWRIFVIRMPDGKFEIIINPKIIKSSKQMLSQVYQADQRFLEGCLSIPGYFGFVDRPAKIKVAYQTSKGLTKTKAFTPPHSSYFQHELDHLNGILFIDHIQSTKQQLYLADAKDKLNPVNKFPA